MLIEMEGAMVGSVVLDADGEGGKTIFKLF